MLTTFTLFEKHGKRESEVIPALARLWAHVALRVVCRVIVTRLMSAAGTGYYYTIKKPRIRERMTLRKYDPVGECVGGYDYVFA